MSDESRAETSPDALRGAKVEELRTRALELRKLADKKWYAGEKEAADQYHREAKELSDRADALDRDTISTPPDGFNVSNLKAPQIRRCPSQDAAMVQVQAKMQKTKQRLQEQGIYQLFNTSMFATNCDRHASEGFPQASHIDLINSSIDELLPNGLTQVIAATELLLVELKKRVT